MGTKILHGLSDHPLYTIWTSIKHRCNPNIKNSYNRENYSDRGIKVCSEWNEFLPFYNWAISNEWKKGLTIDRIDNDGNYEPGNCRVTNYSVQNSNKRKYKRLPRNYSDYINNSH